MKPARVVTLGFLLALAAIQTVRLVLRWRVTVNQVVVPLWASAIAIVILLGLALGLWREGSSNGGSAV